MQSLFILVDRTSMALIDDIIEHIFVIVLTIDLFLQLLDLLCLFIELLLGVFHFIPFVCTDCIYQKLVHFNRWREEIGQFLAHLTCLFVFFHFSLYVLKHFRCLVYTTHTFSHSQIEVLIGELLVIVLEHFDSNLVDLHPVFWQLDNMPGCSFERPNLNDHLVALALFQ